MPVGTILPYAGLLADIPPKWHLCDGTNGTPNLNDRFLQGSTGAINSFIEAGLPNITGTFGRQYSDYGNTGAFYYITSNGSGDGGGGSAQYIGFDASRCSAVYGKSTTVQPDAYTVYYIMKIQA